MVTSSSILGPFSFPVRPWCFPVMTLPGFFLLPSSGLISDSLVEQATFNSRRVGDVWLSRLDWKRLCTTCPSRWSLHHVNSEIQPSSTVTGWPWEQELREFPAASMTLFPADPPPELSEILFMRQSTQLSLSYLIKPCIKVVFLFVFKYIFILIYVHMYFACMYVCIPYLTVQKRASDPLGGCELLCRCWKPHLARVPVISLATGLKALKGVVLWSVPFLLDFVLFRGCMFVLIQAFL